MLAAYPMVLLGRADLPANSLPELIDYARANPGKVNYGDQGKGQTGQLTGEAINYRAKIHMVEIPYRGSAPAITDLLAGQIDLVPDYLLANKSFIDSGKLKLLGVGSRDRLKDYPKRRHLRGNLPGLLRRYLDGDRGAARNAERHHQDAVRRGRPGIPDRGPAPAHRCAAGAAARRDAG